MSFAAAYPGVCVDCDGRFEVGTQIETVPERIGYRHAGACPDDPDLTTAPPCTRCHLIHAPAQKECY